MVLISKLSCSDFRQVAERGAVLWFAMSRLAQLMAVKCVMMYIIELGDLMV